MRMDREELDNQGVAFLLGGSKESSKLSDSVHVGLQKAGSNMIKLDKIRMDMTHEVLEVWKEKVFGLFNNQENKGIKETMRIVEDYLSNELVNKRVIKYDVTVDNMISDTCGEVIVRINPRTMMEEIELRINLL
jgi:hypothetical protein